MVLRMKTRFIHLLCLQSSLLSMDENLPSVKRSRQLEMIQFTRLFSVWIKPHHLIIQVQSWMAMTFLEDMLLVNCDQLKSLKYNNTHNYKYKLFFLMLKINRHFSNTQCFHRWIPIILAKTLHLCHTYSLDHDSKVHPQQHHLENAHFQMDTECILNMISAVY